MNNLVEMGGVGFKSSCYDVVANYKGVWLLAEIADSFCLSYQAADVNKCWKTGGFPMETAVIFLHPETLTIIEILSQITDRIENRITVAPRRMWLVPLNTDPVNRGNEFEFVFMGQRDQKSGYYFSRF